MGIFLGARTTTVEFGRGATRTVTSILTDVDSEHVFGSLAVREDDGTGRGEETYMPEDYPVHMFFANVEDVEEVIKSLEELKQRMKEANDATFMWLVNEEVTAHGDALKGLAEDD